MYVGVGWYIGIYLDMFTWMRSEVSIRVIPVLTVNLDACFTKTRKAFFRIQHNYRLQ